MGRIRYPWSRKTSAPYMAGLFGFLIAILVASISESIPLFVITFIVAAILIYLIVRKIEDGTRKAIDRTFGGVEDKIYDKIMGTSGESSQSSKGESAPLRKVKTVAGTNEWKCVCGKINQNYTGQCICGVRKSEAPRRIEENKRKAQEIAKKKKLQPLAEIESVNTSESMADTKRENENEWKCICGKTNPKFVGTCKCGMRKGEALRRREEALRKSREIMEARKAKEKDSMN